MYEKDPITSVNRAEVTNQNDPEKTIGTPHFLDADVAQHAQPAVPLSEIKRRRTWPTPFILAALVMGLAGGVLASALLIRYQNNSPVTASSTPAPTTETIASPAASQTIDATASAATPEARNEEVASSSTSTTDARDDVATAPSNTVEKRDRTAQQASGAEETQEEQVAEKSREPERNAAPDGADTTSLRGALNEWVAATNSRDIEKQMTFYNPTVNAFYLSRNTPRSAVRAEKARVFERAREIDIRAGDPRIKISPDGQTATMRFRKRYIIAGGGQDRSGEVVQELRWRRVGDKWRIISERDVKVVR